MNFKPFQSSSSNLPIEPYGFVPTLTLFSKQNEDDRDSCFKNSLRENMIAFWNKRMDEIYYAPDMRSPHPFPLARIRKIMKSNQEVKMIGAETPILLAKACEIFVMELTLRAWSRTEENSRRTLKPYDIGRAVRDEDLLSYFLSEIVPIQKQKQEELSHLKETEPHLAHPMHLQNTNEAFMMGYPEIHKQFSSSMASGPLNYHPGSKALMTGYPEVLELFPLSVSSGPSNYHPGSKDHGSKVRKLSTSSTSSGPSNYYPGSKQGFSSTGGKMPSQDEY